MTTRATLSEAFDRFENHPFPGFPESPELQAAYEELVEKGGQLTSLIQQLLTGDMITASQIPTFDAPLPQTDDDPEAREFVDYRTEVDVLRELLGIACQDNPGPSSPP